MPFKAGCSNSLRSYGSWLLLVALIAAFGAYVHAEKQIDHANEARQRSLLLADELRQSSDDLTRMVRCYAVTGDPLYKKHYQEILDIRDGKSPRPLAYHDVYWDLVMADDRRPRGFGPAMPLLELMRRAGITAEEFAKLAEAKKNSDELTHIELKAMSRVGSNHSRPMSSAEREEAMAMLYDANYFRAKADIMRPIWEFDRMVDQRTLAAVRADEALALRLRYVVIFLGIVQIVLLWRTREQLYAILGGSVRDVYEGIARIGRGDFSQAIAVPQGHEHSVLGWLAETRDRLARLELGQFKAIVDSIDEAIISSDLDGLVKSWNSGAQRIFGYSVEQILGRPMHMLWTEQRHDEATRRLRHVLSSLETDRFESIWRHQDGRWIDVSVTLSGLFDEHDRAIGVSAVIRDVTQRKRTEAELSRYREKLEEMVAERTADLTLARQAAEAANVAKSAFLANMSHEIRTPLNAITGMVHLLRAQQLTSQQAQRLDKIDTASQHLLELINAILDLSKIESGKLSVEEADVNVADIVSNVADILADRAHDKHLTLAIDLTELPDHLIGDAGRLRQELLNYAANAIKFTDSGSVTMRCRVEEETPDTALLRFEVQDTGIGIAPDVLPRLFHAFEQADSSTTRKYGGTGLGLAITGRLAEAMGGAAGVQSSPAAGSLFWFTARLRKSGPGARRKADSAADAKQILLKEFAGRRVLIVDDEPVNREIAQLLLEDAGLAIDTAQDGGEALSRTLTVRYTLVLMDMQMPGLDGLAATERLRERPTYRSIPIIAMTANAFAEDQERCARAGMNDFLSKPFAPDKLYSVVLKWMRQSVQPVPHGDVAARAHHGVEEGLNRP